MLPGHQATLSVFFVCYQMWYSSIALLLMSFLNYNEIDSQKLWLGRSTISLNLRKSSYELLIVGAVIIRIIPGYANLEKTLTFLVV